MSANTTSFDQFPDSLAAHLSRPPRFARAGAPIIIGLIAIATAWAHLTTVYVPAKSLTGTFRPAAKPVLVFSPDGESWGSGGGRVIETRAQQGKAVAAGDVLAVFDTDPLVQRETRLVTNLDKGRQELALLDARVDRLREQHAARRGKAEVELRRAETALAAARTRHATELDAATAALTAAEANHARTRALVERGTESRTRLDETEVAVREARRRADQARIPVDEDAARAAKEELRVIDNDYRVEANKLDGERTAKQSEVAHADNDLKSVRVQLGRAEVRAPVAGVVSRGQCRAGESYKPGSELFEIAATDDLVFEALLPADQMEDVRPGRPAHILLSGYDVSRYGKVPGELVWISPDSEKSENRAHFAIRVRVRDRRVERNGRAAEIKLGDEGVAHIEVARRSLLESLYNDARKSFRFD